jgi:hypothetical protein
LDTRTAKVAAAAKGEQKVPLLKKKETRAIILKN